MILRIIGKIMSYCGLAVMIVEGASGNICQTCSNPCPLVMGVGFIALVLGCIIHELDEGVDQAK